MQTRTSLTWVCAGILGVACNAVLGLDQLEEKPPSGSTGGEAGDVGSGGTAGTAGSASGKGGSSGSGTSKGGRGGTSGASTSGAAGDNGAGMGGGGDGDCTPDDQAPCTTADPTLLGNCAHGTVTCRANATWGACSVTPEASDSCDTEGDDADCDGTANGGCPCLNGDTRPCGPDTEDGICQKGTQTCASNMWGDCQDAVFPAARDCLSPNDNDCDGVVDNARDSVCPCAVDSAHVCVEDAPTGWQGPAALATGPATSGAPSCSGTGYERQVASLFGVIDEGTTVCDCQCGDPAGMTCGSSIGIYSRTTSQACQLAGMNITDTFAYTSAAGSCTGSLPSNIYLKPAAPAWSGGTCPTQRTATIPTPRWTRRMTACETNDSDPAGCATQSECVPKLVNPLQAFCIYKDGTNACPSGPYSVQTIYYSDFMEGRSCSACGCGGSTGSCQGYVDFAYGPGTGCARGYLFDRANYGQCIGPWDGNNPPMYGSASVPQAMGSCTPSGGQLQGSVTKSGALTVCCKP